MLHRVSVVALVLFSAITVWGQGTSIINGTVSDASGAIVPNAKVTAIEVETGLTRSTITNTDGLFTVGSLRPAKYTLTVESPGFRAFSQTGITLETDQAATINVKLEIGAATEQVTVEASPAQVDTTTPTLKQVIDSARIEELPLNGRNAASLTMLVAGAVIAPSNGVDEGATKTMPTTGVTPSINGSRSNHTGYYLDGVPNIDFLSNINAPFQNPDALQEFSVQTSGYSAEFGQNAGGVVNIVTRSGTNQLHGSGFGFVRNQAFNARSFFDASRDPLKRWQYGGGLGGPIKRDKVFFFGSYQGTRLRSVNTGASSFVPTDANLAGDFSAMLSATNPNNPLGQAVTVKDPSNNQPFPGNLVPVSKFDRAAVTMANSWLPRAGGNGLVFFNRPNVQDLREYTGKVDYNITNNDRALVRYFRDAYDGPATLADKNLLTYADYAYFAYQNVALTETHVFTPNLLNDFRFGFSYESDRRGPPPNSPSVRDWGVAISQGSAPAIEGINVSGFFNFGSFPVGKFPRASFSWSDTARWNHGRHGITFSGQFERDRLNEYTETNQNGVFSFTNASTGLALSDFLFGKIRTFTQGNGYIQANRYKLFSLAVQDTFKISKRLTLSYGLRWEPALPWEDKFHESEVFFPDRYARGERSKVYTNAPAGEFFPGDEGVPTSGRRSDWMNFAPRVGFALDVLGDGRMSLRGGASITYDARVPGFSNNRQAQSTPFSLAVTLTSPQGPFSNPYLGIVDPFPAPLPPPKNTPFPPPVLVYSWSPNDRLSPIEYSMNFGVERQLAGNWLVRSSYVSTHMNHLNVNQQLNPGVYIPGSSAATDARRAYQGFSGIILASSSGNSWYHSVQSTITKRLSHGLTVLANYTFSKALDNVPIGTEYVTPSVGATYVVPSSMPDFQRLDRGPSDFDRRHVMSMSLVWKLPSLAHSNALLRAAAGGWDMGGILTGRSGTQFTVSSGTDRSLTAIGRDRADLVYGTDPYTSGGCSNILTPCFSYLTSKAFTQPTLGTFGNVGKGVLRGPGAYNFDMSMSKRFKLWEGVDARFRAEAFNALNHMSPGDPTANLSGAGFGLIRSGSTPRVVQLALKFSF
ncbi:MAG: carboxypeptidase regulatory-like domain-containing protein [Candidatus Solibacter sp.]